MKTTTDTPQRRLHLPRISWGLVALVGGALVLVVAALLALPLAGPRPVDFAPISTPQGVVQRFFDATYRGDYVAAYAMLSAETQDDITLIEFQERLRYEQASEMRIDDIATHADSATVTVSVTHFSPGGIFGGSEWTARYDVLLERDGETWKIVGLPLW